MTSSSLNRESYRLIDLSPSDESEEVKPVPDLNLTVPNNHAGLRRKVRLKRKDRDRMTGVASAPDDPGRNPLISAHTFGCSTTRSGLFWVAIVTGLSVLIVLAFLTAKLHVRLSNMELSIIQVMEERNGLQEKFQSLNNVFQEVMGNHSVLSNNVSRNYENLLFITSQSNNLSHVMSKISETLRSAPELKSLPTEVDNLKKNIAQFGSRLTEVELKIQDQNIKSLQERALGSFDPEWQESVENATKSLKLDLNSLHKRLAFIDNLSGQLQQVQAESTKNTEDFNNIQETFDDVRNKFDALESNCCSHDNSMISSIESSDN